IGTISRKALLPGLAGSVSKTYDGTADATLTLANYTGLDFISGDDVALSGYANGSYLDKNVGSHKPVGVSGLSLTGRNSGNYRLISPSALGSGIGVITPAPLTVTAKDDSKVYDGNAYAGGNGVTYSGFAGSDDASDLSGSIAYGGTAQGAVNVGGYTLTVSGLSSSNYDISFAPGTLTISAAALDLSITPQAASKIYGDTLSLTQFDASGLAGSDAISGVTLTSPGTVATADAGSYDIAVSNAVFSSGSASNYVIHYHTLTDGLTVTPRAITVTADNLSRIYGAANPGLTWQLTNGSLVNGDTLSGALATVATTTSDVGDYAIAQGTLDAGGNYALSFNSGTLTIDPKTLTLGLTGTVDKTYDGTADATLALANYSGLGFLSGDTVVLSGYANGAYTDKNAGTGKKVSVSGLSLAGSDAGNYELASASVSGNVGVIDPKSLTVTARDDRVTYDGTAYAGGNGVTYAGFVTDENETDLNGTLVYGGAAQGAQDAGTYGITASGLSSANYDIAYAPGTLVIDPKTLTPSLGGVVSKTYDGNADATLALANYTGLGFVAGDTVALSGYANGSYADKNVGTGKKVSVSGLALTGADAGNYVLASNALSAKIGVIDPKTLTPGLTGTVSKTYDGKAEAALALANYSGLGFVAGDNVALSGYAAGAYDDSNAGSGKKVSVAGLSLSGADAGNYSLASTSLSADIGAIDPATLTITPEDADKTAGQSIVLSGYRVNGLVSGDVVTGVALA
ncbi:MAG: YDG domain-containing protein, partial [Bauldia litoralis]|uniref:YDG domain-containing protein n=1 Tax=Bauldia litoralis TaxID=665467 RepID=UPI003299A933